MTPGSRLRRIAAALALLVAIPALAHADEYRYSMTVRVRPLLLFWISRSGVGEAVVTKERTAAHERYSLLIGSDPERAPRRINRWGYIEEEMSGAEAHLVGLMTKSDEESIAQANDGLQAQAAGRHPFKVIEGTVEGGRASSRVTTITAPSDYTFRQLASALDLARQAAAAGTTRTLPLPTGTRPGFLAALADVMNAKATGPIRYVYYGRLYELHQVRVRSIANVQIGSATFGRGATGDFVVTGLHDGEQTRFSMTYGTAGRYAGVPLAVSYQPRWWMQVELAIDDPGKASAIADGGER